jgi:hypothetical protein
VGVITTLSPIIGRRWRDQLSVLLHEPPLEPVHVIKFADCPADESTTPAAKETIIVIFFVLLVFGITNPPRMTRCF